jgi:hypothetical protein
MLITFFLGTFLQLFQQIRILHQTLRVFTPISKLVGQIFLGVQLLANFEAECAQNVPKKRKIFFTDVNQKKLYFPILVLDQQVVTIVSF